MWTTIAVIAVLLLYFIAVYNGLIARRNQVREAWATVDTQLKRRYDLIPNLIETVRGAAKHESETLAAVTNARNAAMSATGPMSADAQNKLTQTLKPVRSGGKLSRFEGKSEFLGITARISRYGKQDSGHTPVL